MPFHLVCPQHVSPGLWPRTPQQPFAIPTSTCLLPPGASTLQQWSEDLMPSEPRPPPPPPNLQCPSQVPISACPAPPGPHLQLLHSALSQAPCTTPRAPHAPRIPTSSPLLLQGPLPALSFAAEEDPKTPVGLSCLQSVSPSGQKGVLLLAPVHLLCANSWGGGSNATGWAFGNQDCLDWHPPVPGRQSLAQVKCCPLGKAQALLPCRPV